MAITHCFLIKYQVINVNINKLEAAALSNHLIHNRNIAFTTPFHISKFLYLNVLSAFRGQYSQVACFHTITNICLK